MLLERLGCCSSPKSATFAATGDPDDDFCRPLLLRSTSVRKNNSQTTVNGKSSDYRRNKNIDATKATTNGNSGRLKIKEKPQLPTKDCYCSSSSIILLRLAYWNLFSLALFLWACGVSDAESPSIAAANNRDGMAAENLNNNFNNHNINNNWTSPLGDYYYSIYSSTSIIDSDDNSNESDGDDSNVLERYYYSARDIFLNRKQRNVVHRTSTSSSSRTSRAVDPQCKLFDERAIDEICREKGLNRLIELNNTYPFSNYLELGDLSLYRLFGLSLTPTAKRDFSRGSGTSVKKPHTNINKNTYNNNKNNKPALDPSKLAHLDRSLDDCLSDHSSLDNCRNCYWNLSTGIKGIVESYHIFSTLVLSKLNCELGSDIRYSAIFNCSHCKFWYKRWLLLTMKGVWAREPCPEWCHLAELACPHLQASRNSDYAGLPSFRCTDVSIPNHTHKLPKPNCIQACDDWSRSLGGALDISSSDAKSINLLLDLHCKKNQKMSSATRPTRQMYYTKNKRKHSEASSSSASSLYSTTSALSLSLSLGGTVEDDLLKTNNNDYHYIINNSNNTTNRPVFILLTLLRKTWKLQTILLLVLYYLTLMMRRS